MGHVRDRGVTLIGLWLSLAMLALTAGAALIACDLQRSDQLRAMVLQVTSYTQAAQAFKDRYSGPPVDIEDITLTPDGDEACESPDDNADSERESCNGQQEAIGQMEEEQALFDPAEKLDAWQLLSQPDFARHEFNTMPAPGIGRNFAVLHIAVPPASLSGGGYSFSWSQATPDGPLKLLSLGQLLMADADASSVTAGFDIRQLEAQSIDRKLDDSDLATGLVSTESAIASFLPECSTDDADASIYNIEYINLACAIDFTLSPQ